MEDGKVWKVTNTAEQRGTGVEEDPIHEANQRGTGHTPGPWRVMRSEGYNTEEPVVSVHGPDGGYVAMMPGGSVADLADAALIAQAPALDERVAELEAALGRVLGVVDAEPPDALVALGRRPRSGIRRQRMEASAVDWHGWSRSVRTWPSRDGFEVLKKSDALHIGPLPGRKSIALYRVDAKTGSFKTLAFFHCEGCATEALDLLDLLMEKKL